MSLKVRFKGANMTIEEITEIEPSDSSKSISASSSSTEFEYSESVMKVRHGEKPSLVFPPPVTFYPSPNTHIMRGGFAPASEESEPELHAPTPPPASGTCADTRRDFPPHSNAVYNLDTHGRDPKYIEKFESTLDGTGIVLDSIRNRHEGAFDGAAPTPKTGPTPGEILAKTINFNRLASVTTAPGVSGEIYSAKEQREDFIKAMNEGVPLEFCRKCGEKHIPPGSPITLQDRDTCGAYLPDWFPAEKTAKPWDKFTSMVNELIILEQTLKDNDPKKPAKPTWDKEFHDYHPKWQAVGRRGGWWKCKKTPDAPAVERNCKVCHREKDDEEKMEEQKIDLIRARKKYMEDYIEKQVKAQGARDRTYVEDMWRRERILKKDGVKHRDEMKGEMKKGGDEGREKCEKKVAVNGKGKGKTVRIGDDNSSSEGVGSDSSTAVGTPTSDAEIRALLQKVWDGDY